MATTRAVATCRWAMDVLIDQILTNESLGFRDGRWVRTAKGPPLGPRPQSMVVRLGLWDCLRASQRPLGGWGKPHLPPLGLTTLTYPTYLRYQVLPPHGSQRDEAGNMHSPARLK